MISFCSTLELYDNYLSRNSNHHKHKNHQNIVFFSSLASPLSLLVSFMHFQWSNESQQKDIVLSETIESLNKYHIKFMKRIFCFILFFFLIKQKMYICISCQRHFLFRRTLYKMCVFLKFSVVFIHSSNLYEYIYLKFIAIILSIVFFFSSSLDFEAKRSRQLEVLRLSTLHGWRLNDFQLKLTF